MILASLATLLLLLFWIALPGLGWLPRPVVTAIGLASTVALAIWTHRCWSRSSAQYQRESLAQSLLRQLQRNRNDWSAQLNGRQLHDLSADEIHLLAGLVPKLEHAHRLDFYRAFLADVITQGTADTWEGRKVLQELRASCGLSEDEHRHIVHHLCGGTDPDSLLISSRLRMGSFRQQLQKLVLEAVANGQSVAQAVTANAATIRKLREDYAITQHEENQIITELADQTGPLVPLVDSLIDQLFEIRQWQRVLSATTGEAYLNHYLHEQAVSIVRQSFGMLEVFADRDDLAERFANNLKAAHTSTVDAVLHDPSGQWQTLLPDTFLTAIQQGRVALPKVDHPISKEAVLETLTASEDRLAALVAARTAYLYGFKWAKKTLNTLIDTLDGFAVKNRLCRDAKTEAALRITTYEGDSLLCRHVLNAGRARENDWVIHQPQASRHHFRLFKQDHTFYCEDLNSANGTMVNGEIVRSATVAIAGDCKIRVAPDAPAATIEVLQLPPEDLHNPIDRFVACAVMPVFHQLPQPQLVQLVNHSQWLHLAAHKRIDHLFHTKFSTCVVGSGAVELLFSNRHPVVFQRGDLLTAEAIRINNRFLVRTRGPVDLIVFRASCFDQVMTQNKLFRADVLENTNRSLQRMFSQETGLAHDKD